MSAKKQSFPPEDYSVILTPDICVFDIRFDPAARESFRNVDEKYFVK